MAELGLETGKTPEGCLEEDALSRVLGSEGAWGPDRRAPKEDQPMSLQKGDAFSREKWRSAGTVQMGVTHEMMPEGEKRCTPGKAQQ